MKHTAKLFTLVLCLILVLSTTITAHAAPNMDFDIDSKGVLTKYYGYKTDVIIPDGVTEIGRNAFSSNEEITSVTIPASVTKIDEYAFAHCYGLTQVNFSEGLIEIGTSAFYGCINLPEITFPASLQSIGANVFAGCSNLATVNIPDTLLIADDGIFYDTAYLKNQKSQEFVMIGSVMVDYNGTDSHLVIPEGVRCVAPNMEFNNHYGNPITSITVPAGVEIIYDHAFKKLSELETVIFEGDTTCAGARAFNQESVYYKSLWDEAFAVAGTSLVGYRGSGGDEIIPEGVYYIPKHVFDSDRIFTITIPASVGAIDEGAFNYCRQAVLCVEKGSYAEAFAQEHSLGYVYDLAEIYGSPEETEPQQTTASTSATEEAIPNDPGDIGNGGASDLSDSPIPQLKVPEKKLGMDWRAIIVGILLAAAVVAFIVIKNPELRQGGKLDPSFWRTKSGRFSAIGLSYAFCILLYSIAFAFVTVKVENALLILLVSVILGWKFATNVINRVINGIINSVFFGKLFLFGPIKMFVQIFLIRLLLRAIIAMVCGFFVFPYSLGKFMASKLATGKTR